MPGPTQKLIRRLKKPIPCNRLSPSLLRKRLQSTFDLTSLKFSFLALGSISVKKIFYCINLGFLLFSINSYAEQLIVWDIGQGSSHSIIKKRACYHFDLGGERSPLRSLQKLCSNKTQIILISHFDKDHISFVESLLNSKTCLFLPANDPKNYYYKKWKKHQCLNKLPNDIKKIYEPPSGEKAKRNQLSLIYSYKNKVLFTGDSIIVEEEIWTKKIIAKYDYIFLGHHGSSTSNSTSFFDLFGPNSLGIISARNKKYGHPHPKVLRRAKYKKIPSLQTENWGTLIFEL